MDQILKDIRVLDLSSVLAGPSVGMFLAELGAEVIKIENPATNGDVTRTWKNPAENENNPVSAYYLSVNAFKKEIKFLNLHQKENIDYLHSIIHTFDIVISNFKYQDDKKFKLDYQTLKNIHPQIIYAHITGFGYDNPRIAFDLILQAETGYMYLNREPEHLPNKMPVALIDVLAAHHLKEGILLALYQKLKHNKGAYVHCSLYNAAVCSLINQSANYTVAQYNPPPMGSMHPNIAPYGEIFVCKDKTMLTFAIGTDKQFADLCSLLNIPHYSDFSDNIKRVKNREHLYKILQQEIQKYDSRDLYQNALQNNIPVAIIKDIAQVINHPATQKLIKPVYFNNQTYNIITSIAFEML